MERLFERLGYASQWVTDTLQKQAAAASERGEHLREGAEDLLEEAGDHLPDGLSPEIIASVTSAAGAWAASRFLSRGRVSWSRAVVAGVAGTLLYDLVARLDQRLSARGADAHLGGEPEDDHQFGEWANAGARYGAGIALSLFYAGYLHHRLPGPAPLRGAILGGLDAAALRWGGILPLLNRLHLDIDLPAGVSSLTDSQILEPRALARHLAFGIGVGTVYGRG